MDPSDVARKSYFSSFLSLLGYGLSSIFGRISRGFFGLFNSPFKAELAKDEAGNVSASFESGDKVDAAQGNQEGRHFCDDIKFEPKLNDCKVNFEKVFTGDVTKMPKSGNTFNTKYDVGGEGVKTSYDFKHSVNANANDEPNDDGSENVRKKPDSSPV